MSSEPEPLARRLRPGRVLLLAAWLLLVAVVGAAVGYVATRPAPAPEPRAQLSLAEAPESDGRAEVASAPEPQAGSATAVGSETAAEPRSAAGDGDPAAEGSPPPPAPPGQEANTQTASDPPSGDAGARGAAGGASADTATTEPADRVAERASGSAPESATDSAAASATDSADDGEAGSPAAQADRTSGQTARLPPPVSQPDAQPPAWKRYARTLNPPEGMPKIAVVLRGLGLSSAAAEAAVTRLPATISLSFSAYARDSARAWALRARRQGHEVLVDLPMEPVDYPARDPGPQALMTDLADRRNLDRLDWILAQVDRKVGVVAEMGSAFLASRDRVRPVLEELKARGLMYLDNGVVDDGPALALAQSLDLPHAVSDRSLDSGQVSRPAIDARLVEAERLARRHGLAVVLARPFPVTIDALEAWSRKVEQRGFVLVPATHAALQRAGKTAANLR